MKKLLTAILVFLLLAVPVSGCLDTAQIFLIGKVAEQSNISVTEFVAVFNMLCERDENITNNIILITEEDVNETIEEHLASYKAEIAGEMSMLDILLNNTQAIQAMTKILNVSQAVDAINARVEEVRKLFDDKQVAFEDRITSQVQDYRAEAITRNEFDGLTQNISVVNANINILFADKQQQPNVVGWEVWTVLVVVIVVIGGTLWFKKKKEKETKKARDSAPQRDERPNIEHISHHDEDKEAEQIQKMKDFVSKKEEANQEAQAEAEAIMSTQVKKEKEAKDKKKEEPENDDAFGE